MRQLQKLLFLAAILHASLTWAQTAADLRGVYVGGNSITHENPTSLTAAFGVPGVDGFLLNIGWADIEPTMGQYQWATIDLWMGRAISAGKKITLSVSDGANTPTWLFQPAPGGAGANPLNFSISRKGGLSGSCDPETIAAPWDPAFLAQWDAMLAALSTHLKSTGTYNAVTLLRLTGINRDTDELHLPAETPQSTGLACVSDAIATWLQAGYRPSLLLQGWDGTTSSFQKYFPDKSFTVAIIASSDNPFPTIAEDGSVITNLQGLGAADYLPLMTLANQKFPGHLVIQNNSLYPGVPAQPVTVNFAQTLGNLIAFQTNEDTASSTGKIAACGTGFANQVPCTSATYMALLETGIYPAGLTSSLRAQYIEVFATDVNSYPSDILQAHSDLFFEGFVAGGQTFSSSGGNGSINLTFPAGLPWTATSNANWITLTGSTSGTGNGTLSYQLAANNGPGRSATITVAGNTFTIEQQGSLPGLSFIGSMPHMAAEENWTTNFTLVNKSTSPATGRLSMFGDPAGALTLPIAFPQQPPALAPLLAASFDRTLAANASLIIASAGPQIPPVQVGSAQLSATGAVDGFAIFHLIPGAQEAVVPMETRNANSYLLAFDNTGGVVLGVALENVAAQAANVKLVIRDDSGTQIATHSIPMSPNGHTSFVLSTQYPITANKRGTVEFDTPAGGQISVLGIRTTPLGTSNTLTTIPALANVGTTGGSMAHIATGNGWQTTFVLVNAGTAAAQLHLKFFDDGGNPLSLPLTFPQSGGGATSTAPSVDQILAAGATLIVQSAAPSTDPTPTIGSAQLTTNGNIGGFVIFRYNPNGQEAVVPLETRSAAAFLLAFDNTAQTATGIAVNNVSTQAVNIPIVVRNDAGMQIATDTLNLSANGHLAFTLAADKYPATAGIRGTIEFDTPTGAQIGALGIRIPFAHTFTTLPALTK